MSIQPDLAQQIIQATDKLKVAQHELEAAMAELTVAAHADTTFVSERLRNAFREVAAAKVALAAIVDMPL